MKKIKKRTLIFGLLMVMIIGTSIIAFATTEPFYWNGYTINSILDKTGKHSARAETRITNISAPHVYKVRALINAKKTKDGTGNIIAQDYQDSYNVAFASVYHGSAKSFVSHHNIQVRGSVAKSHIIKDVN